jgi:hypothetical protein
MNLRTALLLAIIMVSCDLTFEAPYEDLNGIYLQLIASYDCQGYRLLFDGPLLYIRYGSSIAKYELSNKDSLKLISSYPCGIYLLDFCVHDGYAYCAKHDEIRIIDFNVTQPELLSVIDIDHVDIIKYSNAYCFAAHDRVLYVIDVANKENPAIHTSLEFNSSIVHLEVEENRVFIITSHDDLYVCAMDSSGELNQIQHMDVNATSFAVQDSVMYSGGQWDIYVYTLRQSGNIEYVSQLRLGDFAVNRLCIDGAYGCTSHEDDLYLLDSRYPERLCISEILTLPQSIQYCIINENRIYVLSPYLHVIEIKEIPR